MIKKLFSNPQTILLFTFFLLIGIYCAHALLLQKTVYGDGAYYVNWLTIQNIIPNNKYAIGPAILWSPFYFWAHAIFQTNYLIFPYQFILGLTSVLYGITGLILLYRLLLTFTKPLISAITISLIALASHFLFYGAVDPVNSHALSFFAAALFLTFLFQKQLFLSGVALGLIALIRPQDAIYGILLLPFINKKTLLVIAIGFLIFFSPQMIVWFSLTGNPILSPYFTGGEHFSFLAPHLFSVLFSLQNGLLVYTPLFLISLLGYMRSWEKQQSYKWLSLILLFLSLYLVASWSSFDQGASYSGRMFISMLPIIAIALSKLLTYLAKRKFTEDLMILTFLVPLGSINTLLILYFLLTHR